MRDILIKLSHCISKKRDEGGGGTKYNNKMLGETHARDAIVCILYYLKELTFGARTRL